MQTPNECSAPASPERSITITVAQFSQATAEGEVAQRLPQRRPTDPTLVSYRTTSW